MNDYQIKDLTERLVKLGYKRGPDQSHVAGPYGMLMAFTSASRPVWLGGFQTLQ
jgi:hypothetical protein